MSARVALLVVAAVLLWPGQAGRAGRAGQAAPAGAGSVAGSLRRVVAARVRWRRHPDADWVAELAEVAAVGLGAGLDLPSAAVVAARSPAVVAAAPWLAPRLDRAALHGSGPSACLTEPRSAPVGGGEADLQLLVRAWRLSEETGAAASHTTAAAAAAIRARTAARERTESALAGPRASMRLLTALPLAGPLVGLMLGVTPADLYGSVAAQAAAGAGLVLTVVGWAWACQMIHRAGRPGRTDGGP